MRPEVSLTVLKTFKWFIYSLTKLIACDHEYTNPSKVFINVITEFSKKLLEPAVSFVVDQDATTAPARHM